MPPMKVGKAWDKLNDRQRWYRTAVLGHDRHDCVGMHEVCRRAATELAAET